tara:strand:+ start:10045 stop:12039 length:1995 start_codon:yes stop_codon:yes gene_type:complete
MPISMIIVVPLASAIFLALSANHINKKVTASVACAAVLASWVVSVGNSLPLFLNAFPSLASSEGSNALERTSGEVMFVSEHLYTWFAVDRLSIELAFKLDALGALMVLVVTSVGFLIHLYAAAYMVDDTDYARFFCYMNLFIAAMLTLVLADNLVLLYLGWEGVGVCSYLLIGFWYQDPANGAAAQKAFIITRIGDASLMIAILFIAFELGTLQFDEIAAEALRSWPLGSSTATIVSALLLVGALGKSAQLPLQTWLPDAMAGPTPVSALLHAATMVTAGVYLIARTHELFLLAPAVLGTVATLGALTAFFAACTALFENDIKRVLAYSTISQIGYMFVALGVAGFTAAMFHFVAHAFFKALLFLSAGNVTHCVQETDIRRMGGLRRSRALPGTAAVAAVGTASLAGLPLITSGFYSKDAIFWSTLQAPFARPGLLLLLLVTAALTSLYAFRWYFMIFSGPASLATDQEINRPRDLMLYPLVVLAAVSLLVGFLEMPDTLGGDRWIKAISEFLHPVFASAEQRYGLGTSSVFGTGEQVHRAELTLQAVSAAIALLGLIMAYHWYVIRPSWKERLARSPIGRSIAKVLRSGWAADEMYSMVIVTPYRTITHWLRHDPVDDGLDMLVGSVRLSHYLLVLSQNGRIRTYAAGMVVGASLLFLSWLWS